MMVVVVMVVVVVVVVPVVPRHVLLTRLSHPKARGIMGCDEVMGEKKIWPEVERKADCNDEEDFR